ncbi:MAG: hypothetical protein LCH96_14085 [Actinobacteria bacterium]|nr:hypothetical protein [Actinomycetota bacterium]
MGSLFHPVGSQPAWVYWARRGAIVAAAVLLIGLFVYLLRPQPEDPVAAVPATTPATPTISISATPTESTTPTASATPTGPLMCDASNSTLTLAGYQKVKQDAKQTFRVGLTNNGGQPCVLDLKPSTFSLTVTSGSDRIWSTDDCAKWVPTHKQTLKSKKTYEFTISWPVARSAAGCKTAKAVLGEGTYVAAATFAADAKARQVFVVTKAS